MDVPEASEQAPAHSIFSSDDGYALCQHILKDLLPYEPHDVQIEDVCKVLDHIDLFSILPTGSGKTSFLFHVHACCISYPKRPISLSHKISEDQIVYFLGVTNIL
jgi:hypothetical protein